MLKKKYVKSRDVVKVTFELPVDQLPADVVIESVTVAGDFNGWDISGHPLKYSKKKKEYRATVELPPNTVVQFRYVINGIMWWNDWAADGYVPNAMSGDNCVVSTAREE